MPLARWSFDPKHPPSNITVGDILVKSPQSSTYQEIAGINLNTCRTCQRMLSTLAQPGKSTTHHHSSPDELTRASSKCYICSWTYSQMSEDQKAIFYGRPGYSTATLQYKSPLDFRAQYELGIHLWIGTPEDFTYCYTAEFMVKKYNGPDRR